MTGPSSTTSEHGTVTCTLYKANNRHKLRAVGVTPESVRQSAGLPHLLSLPAAS